MPFYSVLSMIIINKKTIILYIRGNWSDSVHYHRLKLPTAGSATLTSGFKQLYGKITLSYHFDYMTALLVQAMYFHYKDIDLDYTDKSVLYVVYGYK